MAHVDIQKLRNDSKWGYDRTAMRNLSDYNLYPTRKWGEFIYAVAGEIDLRAGAQRLRVYDITGCMASAALFVAGYYGEYDTLAELLADYPNANVNVLIYEGEGNAGILNNDGFGGRWLSSADLPIEVVPASTAARHRIREEQWEELEGSVDTGGSIGL